MAEMVISALASLARKEAEGLSKLASMTDGLLKEHEALRGFLSKAEERQEDDKEIRKWMSQLKNVNYEIEHLTDKHLDLIQRRRRRMHQGNTNIVFLLYGIAFDDLMLRREASKIHALTARISRLTAEMRNYGIEFTQIESTGVDSTITDAIEGSSSLLTYNDEDELITGVIDEDLKTMEKKLVYEESTRVLGICGADGLGKTTLARELLKRSIVDAHFEAVAWIYAGDLSQSNVEGVVHKLLVDLQGDEQGRFGEDDEQTRGILKRKRCLVVVDDLQSIGKWNLLASALSSIRDSSSKLLITTCDPRVLRAVDCGGFLHQPRFLNSEERWQLFQNKTASLRSGVIRGYKKEKLGKAIVPQCIGLPLTIQVLGGVLTFDTDVFLSCKGQKLYHNLIGGRQLHPKSSGGKLVRFIIGDHLFKQLQYILGPGKSRHPRNSSSSGGESEETIMEAEVRQVLQLSYAALPRHLKPCLVKMSEHRELGFEIPALELCKAWIEDGVVKSQRGSSLEEVARGYMGELVKRSLIQVVSKESDGGIKTCQLHCLVRDFHSKIPNRLQQDIA